MKQYKVGDTIAVKAKVIRATNGSEMPYQVSYITGYDNGGLRSGNSFWVTDSEIVEPVKPVLPKNVADEMEAYKEYGDDFNEYIYNVMAVPDTHYLIKTHDTFIRSNVTVETLLNAWNNGYTVEKPKLYNLVLGKNMWGWPLALYKPTGNDNNLIAYPDAAPKYLRDSVYQFTQEEIDKYNKDFWIKNLDLNDYKVEVEE